MSKHDDPVLEVESLKKTYIQNGGYLNRLLGAETRVQAVTDVSFEIEEGETLGLVGESGSGKSTVARCLLRLDEPTAGAVRFKGNDLTELSNREMDKRRKEFQMVFQDPASSLNRRKTIAQIIRDPMEIHGLYKGKRDERINELLETVGLSATFANRYSHELSGGQRQRVGIARALAVDPDMLVADEPVSALDVSIQAQILNLLEDLQDEFGLTLLVISHDLSVVNHICDRVAVMYLGELMEVADTKSLFNHSQHPYTKALLESIPQPAPEFARRRKTLHGTVPSPTDPPSGCVFHTRCPESTNECTSTDPPLKQAKGAPNEHIAACIHVDEFEADSSVSFIGDELYNRYAPEQFKNLDAGSGTNQEPTSTLNSHDQY